MQTQTSAPSLAVQFCNMLVTTNSDPELRNDGCNLFEPHLSLKASLDEATALLVFSDHSYVLEQNRSLKTAQTEEEFLILLTDWAGTDPDCYAVLNELSDLLESLTASTNQE